MKDDGIYTGFIASHRINGAGGKYFSYTVGSISKRSLIQLLNDLWFKTKLLFFLLKVETSGEGVLPDKTKINVRTKRCAGCSLGNITRVTTGKNFINIYVYVATLECTSFGVFTKKTR